MKKLLSVGLALVVVSLAGLAFVGAASAQEPATAPLTRTRFNRGHLWGCVRAGAGVVSDAILELLGLTPDELHAERAAGKTLAEIAKEQGVSDQDLIEAIVAGRIEVIEQALAAGEITQEQADWLIAKAEALAPFMLTNPFAPGQARGRMRGGLMRGLQRFGPCPMQPSAPEGSSS